MNFFTDFILTLYNILFQNLGITIIVLAIASRAIFLPSSIAMMRNQKKMQDLKPKLDEIKRKHDKDKKKQMEEQTRLFKEHGVNPASSCLNAIVQMVIAIILYNALHHIINLDYIHKEFFFWNLAKPDTFSLNLFNNTTPIPGILVLITAVAQLILSKMMTPVKPLVEETKKIAKKKKVDQVEKQDMADTVVQMQSQMVFMFPVMIIFFGLSLPAGLGLYWVFTTIFTIIQQYYFVGFGGLADWLPKHFVTKYKR